MKRNKSGAVPMTCKMSEENYDAPAATKVCRICLAMDTKMYNITESKLDIMFQDITGLVGWSERLPQRVCWECAARLSSAYQFREKALRSDELLKELIQPYSYQSGTFECSICKRRLKTKKALQKHLALHTLQYSCNSCSFVAKSRYVAREHQKLHAGHKYQCRHCPRQFTKSSSYLSHLRLKHVSDIACEICGYMFVSKYGLEMHKRLKHSLIGKDVTLDGPYCQICDVKFASEEAYDRHLKLSAKHSNEHGSKPPRNQMTYRRLGQTQHQRTRRINDSIPINCEQCGELQRNMISYAQHFRRLHPEKVRTKYPTMKTPSMCDQCGKIFANNICLEYHKWVHTGVKKFQCDLCRKKFTQKPSLMFHMKSHKGVTYECSMCDKRFTHPNNRNRHVKSVHIGARPYKCHTCNKSFTTSGGLKGHVEHVHRNVPWPKRTRPSRVSKKKCEEPRNED